MSKKECQLPIIYREEYLDDCSRKKIKLRIHKDKAQYFRIKKSEVKKNKDKIVVGTLTKRKIKDINAIESDVLDLSTSKAKTYVKLKKKKCGFTKGYIYVGKINGIDSFIKVKTSFPLLVLPILLALILSLALFMHHENLTFDDLIHWDGIINTHGKTYSINDVTYEGYGGLYINKQNPYISLVNSKSNSYESKIAYNNNIKTQHPGVNEEDMKALLKSEEDIFLKYKVVDNESGQVLTTTEFIKPAMAKQWNAYKDLEPGKYSVSFIITAYRNVGSKFKSDLIECNSTTFDNITILVE